MTRPILEGTIRIKILNQILRGFLLRPKNTRETRNNELNGRNEKGQSTIELITTLVFVLGFVFLFVKTALYTTNHFMAQYFTFMASRSYLVMDNSSNTPEGADSYAEQKARTVMGSFPLEALELDEGSLSFNTPTGSNHKVLTGPFFNFTSEMTLGGLFGGDQELELVSESFLLREPPRMDCMQRVCDSFQALGADPSCELHITIADNGC